MNNPSNHHAIVIGGSLAGLLAARVLSDHFERVTILERDPVHDRPESRKGQPQTRHPHGLLTSGLKFVNRYFPDLETELVEKGAIIADQGLATRFFFAGSYRTPFESGLKGILVSRPLMEWQIRRRVAALPNVTLCDESPAEKLVTTPDRTRVTGVVIERRGAGKGMETLTADFVVDASGRGSPATKWLESIGYAQLEESVVKIDVSYSTRLYRRNPGDLGGAYVVITLPWYPAILRGGFMVAQENNFWMLTLAGWGGDHPPSYEAGFVEFARSLSAPDMYETIHQNEPLSDIVVHKFPSNLRRHYEKMSRFPEGYLVLGDAVCSFNPIYGQGMSSAALQAAELDKVFTEQQEQGHSQGLWQRYFKRVAKVVDSIWQSAVGADFNYPTTEGKKAPGTDLINAYMTRLTKVSNHDPVVCLALLKAMNLLVPSTSLFHPRIMRRVLRGEPQPLNLLPGWIRLFRVIVRSNLMTNFTGLRILIVGGGLAGLSLAIALRQRGLIPDIIERASEFSTDGTGLFIVGNGTRALKLLGFSDLPMSQGDAWPEGQMCVISKQAFLNHRGTKLAEIDLETFWAGCGPCLGIRRSVLHRLFLEQMAGLPIRFGLTVQALHQEKDQVSVHFSDGSKEIYDLIVGADGIDSTIRQLEFGESNPEFLGQVAWRFIAPLPPGIDRWSVFLGPRRTFLILPIGPDESYCYADETITSQPILFSSNEPVMRLRKLFRDFASPVSDILAQLESYSQIHYSAIQEVARQHWGRGRVVLIGDAAHAMSPNMASGAAMAFEDALVLADIICQVGDPSEIVPQFILRRSARVSWLQGQTHRRDRIRNLPPVIRDLFLKFLVRKIYQTNYQPLLEPI